MANPTIGEYLISRLQDYKITHVFGIPGDYVLGFYDLLYKSPIEVVGTTREDCAGFAADAYSRIHGIGALCVTYCVGGLNVTNPIAQAYAEKSPVVMLTGSPGLNERHRDPLLHHKVRTFTTQRDIFAQITCANTVLENASTAFSEIDRVLEACWEQKRPVYIELPRDMTAVRPRGPYTREKKPEEKSDRAALAEALDEAVALLNAAKRPVILADVEVHRFGLQKKLLQLLEKTNIPFAATILGKSVISELHPQYVGVYEGAMGRPEVTRVVENSDCLLMLGTFLTDINLGIFTAQLDRGRTIEATSEKIQIGYHAFEEVGFADFLNGLIKAPIRKRAAAKIPKPVAKPFTPRRSAPITVRRFFQRLNELLEHDMTVISDVGDCLFGSTDLIIHQRTEFLAPAYYTSMGFAVPAALGAQCANPRRRPIVLVGDGAFQMTGMELSTIARLKMNPIVVILNNHGYTTERFIMEGPYNDIPNWHYTRMPELLGSGRGFYVQTEGDFEDAWQEAVKSRDEFCILDVQLEKLDRSVALERLGKRLAARLKRK